MTTYAKRIPGTLSAATCLLDGFGLLKRPSIRGLVFVPLAINLILYSAALWVSVHYFGRFLDWLLPTWLDFLQWLLWPVFGLAFLLLVGFGFTLLATVLGAPFYSVLAEKLLASEGVIDRRGSSGMPVWRSLFIELRRTSGYLLRAIPLLLLFLIPGINVLAPFVWLAFSAWYLARGFFSYPFDALGLGYAEQETELRKFRVGGLIFGGLVQLVSSLPLINVLTPPAAVLGASAYVATRLKARSASRPDGSWTRRNGRSGH